MTSKPLAVPSTPSRSLHPPSSPSQFYSPLSHSYNSPPLPRPNFPRNNSARSIRRPKSIIEGIRKRERTSTSIGVIEVDDSWAGLLEEGENRRRLNLNRSASSQFNFTGSPASNLIDIPTESEIHSLHSKKSSTSLLETGNAFEVNKPVAKPWLSRFTKNLIKCVFAYAIASLFTYSVFFCDFLGSPFDVDGPVRNAHVVATVAVYFNPAKNLGQMIESNFFMLIGLSFGLFLCTGSMMTTIYLDSLGYIELAHGIVLIFWIGLGLGFMSYWKARLNRTSLITTGSLVSLLVCVIVTKEGAFISEFPYQVIQQMMLIAFIGISISNLICLLLFPLTATFKLQQDLNQTLFSFSSLLGMLASTFLQESNDHLLKDFKSAVILHKSAFATLSTSLGHAAYEGSGNYYTEIVESMTRLAQDLTGLRACIISESNNEDDQGNDDDAVFELFKGRVGESMKKLISQSQESLSSIQQTISSPKLKDLERLNEIRKKLQTQLGSFKSIHSGAVKFIYQRTPSNSDPFQSNNLDETFEKEGTGNGLFRVYYFGVNLSGFVDELMVLMDSVLELKRAEQKRKAMGMFRRFFSPVNKKFSIRKSAVSSPFPVIFDRALTSNQSYSTLSFMERLQKKIWLTSFTIAKANIRFGIKVGLGAAILATPAFLSSTRGLYLHFRGEWALVSYMIIMSPTVGGTNKMAFSRVFGTLIGAGSALMICLIAVGDPVILFCLGILYCIYPFSLILSPGTASNGRFLLLTYNLTALYSYNLRDVNSDVVSIAWHRSTSVIIGVLWALIISRLVFPYEARRELRKKLAIWFINSAYLYERIVKTYSSPNTDYTSITANSSETSPLIETWSPDAVDEFLQMEIALQQELDQISSLLGATANEFRLKGPFPWNTYKIIIQACQTILDLLTSMRSLSTEDHWVNDIREDFVAPVQSERREMVGNVLLFFNILSSSVSLGAPLSPFLPPALEAQQKLMSKLLNLSVVQQRIMKGGDSLLYLAYVSSMQNLIIQLELIGEVFMELYGVMGGSSGGVNSGGGRDFESYFV